MSHEVEERRLKMLIEQYVEVRKKRHDIVSVRQIAGAVLTVMKACPVSRRELDDMIDASAVAHGLCVAFDVQQYPSQFRSRTDMAADPTLREEPIGSNAVRRHAGDVPRAVAMVVAVDGPCASQDRRPLQHTAVEIGLYAVYTGQAARRRAGDLETLL